jgi:hypothetical protein
VLHQEKEKEVEKKTENSTAAELVENNNKHSRTADQVEENVASLLVRL